MTESIQVQIVYAMPETYWLQELRLPVNSTLQQALALLDKSLFPADMVIDSGRLAVYGQRAKPGDRLCDMDRIEVIWRLVLDTKYNGRQRASLNRLKKPKR